MKSSQKISLISACVAIVVGVASPVARADGVAQSILDITNFGFRLGNGAAGSLADGSLLPNITSASATTTSDAFAKLNGVVDTGSAIPGPLNNGQRACVGNCVAYVPGTILLGTPVTTYSGSNGNQTGNALTASASAKIDNTVSLRPTGIGSTSSNVNLNGLFSLTIAQAGTRVEFAFDAAGFLRAMYDKAGSLATAAYSFALNVTDNSTGLVAFQWQPNGLNNGSSGVSGTVGGIEYADAFNLNDTISRVTVGNVQRTNSGHFEAETNGLATGEYTISINQIGRADASVVPEPGSLALLGVALFGAAAAARRRAAKR